MMVLMGLFGLLAVVIAGAGIFGVVAYSVAERTKEIGGRVAIGASPGAVLRMVLRGALQYLTIGVLLGLPAALLLTQALGAYLFEVQPHDPSVYLTAIGAFLLTALTAAYVPARRATQIDPVTALRAE
ncbi:MAG: FtsX-like permease family protein [Vicinamibacterales bacterium]|jgi:ABC-type antimicrobial peptide transport system permease subunit